MSRSKPGPHGWRRGVSPRLLVKGVVLALGALLVGAVAGSRTAAARESIPAPAPTVADEVRDLSRKLEEARNQLALARVQAQRTAAIIRYSADFRIPADLASAIYDIALSEGIDPEVGFRLVKVESNFDSKALSTKGAIGYTQVQLATAKSYEPSLSSDQLYQRDVNLRLGFRFLRDLLGKYRSDLQLALIAYNRGPSRVQEILDNGGNPDNGYAAAVLRGTSHAHE